MSLFIIDEKKCRKDGICAAECPLGLIMLGRDGACPQPVAGAERLCINCGHCMAVCPYGAFSLKRMDCEECPPLQRDLLPSAGQVRQMVRARRSIRLYQDKIIGQEVLAELIDTARYAPTGRNSQQLGWLVINDPLEVNRLAGLAIDWMGQMIKDDNPMVKGYGMTSLVKAWEQGKDPILRHAPALLLVHAPSDYRIARIDASIALASLELTAFAGGLGTCWAGFFDTAVNNWPALQRDLDFGVGRSLFGAMMIGYPKYCYHRLPLRDEPQVTWRGAS
ncbi:MAG: nitroreductase family protein [Thermodesulfobacteriota bacterium]